MVECPICLDELDLTDRSFKPCKCGYQMCRFCWNHINENLNGKCPACRQPYKTENYKFNPPNPEEIQRIQNAKKARERERKHAEANARKNLANVRVIQRNLVYLTNLALTAATEEILKRPEYFGKFGKIKKIVVNRSNVYQGPQGSSVSAYITYFKNKDAHAAIKAVDGSLLDGRLLRASFGTTKYCSYFLRNVRCPNPDCMYLHELGNDVDSFTKEDMAQGKHLLSNITLNPEENIKQNQRRDLTRSHPAGRKQNNVAWKTVVEGAPAPSPVPQAMLNPDEWPDSLSESPTQNPAPALSQTQAIPVKAKKAVTSPSQPPNPPATVPVQTPPNQILRPQTRNPEATTPSAPPPATTNISQSPPAVSLIGEADASIPGSQKSALPATASWASKTTDGDEDPKNKVKPRNVLTTSLPVAKTSPTEKKAEKKGPVSNPKKIPLPTNPSSSKAAAFHEESESESESEEDSKTNLPSNKNSVNEQEVFENSDDDYDDGIDNATYDERMARLTLDIPSENKEVREVKDIKEIKEVEEEKSNEGHEVSPLDGREESEGVSCPASPEAAPPGFDTNMKLRTEKLKHIMSTSLELPKHIETQPTVQHLSQSQDIPKNINPQNLQNHEIFGEWLRANFTHLLLDNSNDIAIPGLGRIAPIFNSQPIWNCNFPFFTPTMTSKSRFDFARNEDVGDSFFPPPVSPPSYPHPSPHTMHSNFPIDYPAAHHAHLHAHAHSLYPQHPTHPAHISRQQPPSHVPVSSAHAHITPHPHMQNHIPSAHAVSSHLYPIPHNISHPHAHPQQTHTQPSFKLHY
uniref:RING-type domain-containing protein n=1 Tax=Arcella intermedia TaxID=1963864 RepID=A0A6B2KYD3_9EUKA